MNGIGNSVQRNVISVEHIADSNVNIADSNADIADSNADIGDSSIDIGGSSVDIGDSNEKNDNFYLRGCRPMSHAAFAHPALYKL